MKPEETISQAENTNNTAVNTKLPMQQINEWLGSNVIYLLFLFVLVLLYIRNTHFSESIIRDIEKTKATTKAMRWEYMTVKAELMFQTKQTEIAKLVANQGLKELTNPPQKITIKKQ